VPLTAGSFRRFGVVVILPVLILVGVWVPAQADVPVDKVGWWTRAAVPPSVTDGGIAVGVAPDGALTVGAIELSVGAGASGTSLRLVETAGEGQQVAAIQACPTGNGWSADKGGDPATSAPKDQCSIAAVPFRRSDDGSWSADLDPLAAGKSGELSIMVVPAAGQTPVGAFQISFAPPIVGGEVAQTPGGATSTNETSVPPASTTAVPDTPPASQSMSTPALYGIASPGGAAAQVVASPSVVEQPATAAPPSDSASRTQSSAPTGEQAAATAETPGSLAAARMPFTRRSGGKLEVFLWLLLGLPVLAGGMALYWLRTDGKLSRQSILAIVKRTTSGDSL